MARRTFDEFYRTVYLPDHADTRNRWVHFLSNIGAVTFLTLAAITWRWELFVVGVFLQLGPPYLGHIVFEGSHNSIDTSPIFSAMGSWRTTFEILRGRQRVSQHPSAAPLTQEAPRDDIG